jgi:L-amino acid N-acyltransferase YncA
MTKLRPARAGDAAQIADIYVDTWRTSYPGIVPDKGLVNMSSAGHARAWMRRIRQGHDVVLVAERRDTGVIGFGSAGPNRVRSSRFDGEIYTLYVQPDFQEQGVGRQLMNGLFRSLEVRGFKGCIIRVLAANPSRFFYAAMDGQICGEHTEPLWGDDVPVVSYGWENLAALGDNTKPRAAR